MGKSNPDRWKQRLENYRRALGQLQQGCAVQEYSDLERAGLVQFFEFTLELAWKTLKDRLVYDGYDVASPREVIRKGLVAGYLSAEDTEVFLEAVSKRNLLSHTYDEQAVSLIKESFAPVMERLFGVLVAGQES